METQSSPHPQIIEQSENNRYDLFKLWFFLFLSIPGFKRRSKNHDLTKAVLGWFHILSCIWH